MHVVKLQPPGKPLEEEKLKLAIHAAADVFDDGMKRLAVRRVLLNPRHGVREGPPFSGLAGGQPVRRAISALVAEASKSHFVRLNWGIAI